MKYFIEWLKSFEIGLTINPHMFNLSIFIFSFFIGVESCSFVYGLSIRLPKYAFILSPGEHFFYKNSSYWFYRKVFSKYIRFYILHVIGSSATQIEGKESKWVG
jgi:hypothetical protein